MNIRPAGESSEEEDEYNTFTLDGDATFENENKERMARKLYEERQLIENLPVTKVYNAIVTGNLNLIIKEFENNFDIESIVFNEFTGLQLAASLGNFEIVNEFLERGANPKFENDSNFTVLMAACSCLRRSTSSEKILKIIKKLLEFDVNVLQIDRKRRTAFMLACEQGFIEVIQFLQPLSNLESEDNQGWTALFYAVESKNIEVVTFLINIGANYNHNDIRNNNIRYYAALNEFQAVLKLLPDDSEISTEDLIQYSYNYEEMFEKLHNDFRPSFQQDLALLLFGMKCEKLIPLFNISDINLITFLTLNDSELESAGICMSFQRNRILQGLYRFHERNWKKSSVPIIPRNEMFTTTDLFAIITTSVKHLLIMEATLNYLNKNFDYSPKDSKEKITTKILAISNKISTMKVIIQHLQKNIQKFNKIGIQSDIIKKDFNFKKNRLNKIVAAGVAGISTLCILAYCRGIFYKK